MARLDRPAGGGSSTDRRGDWARVSDSLLAAVVRKREAELDVAAALDRLIAAGLLFRQGVPPHATYFFKHALVQDAAYGTLLREPRRALHARIAETLETQFVGIAESQPELLARHCTDAGLIEKVRRPVGQGGTAVAGTLGVVRGRGAAHPRACPVCDITRHSSTASRADQASGRANYPTPPCQRVCRS